MKSEDNFSPQESHYKPGQCVEKQRHYSADKGPFSQGYGLTPGHIWLWELDCKGSTAPKNWCLQTAVLEKTPESPLDCKEIQPVHPKGSQTCIPTGRTDAEAEAPVFWPWWEEPTHWKRPWCSERLRAEGRGHQRRRWLDGITDTMDMNLGQVLEMVRDREAWCAAVHRVSKSREWLWNWTTIKIHIDIYCIYS